MVISLRRELLMRVVLRTRHVLWWVVGVGVISSLETIPTELAHMASSWRRRTMATRAIPVGVASPGHTSLVTSGGPVVVSWLTVVLHIL